MRQFIDALTVLEEGFQGRPGPLELMAYFNDRPLDVAGNHYLSETWDHFVQFGLSEDNLAKMAVYLGKDAEDINASDYAILPKKVHDAFIDWMEDRGDFRYMIHDDPMGCPAWMLISPIEMLPASTWLIHFTDHADAIAAEGFTRGVTDMDRLALTYEHGAGGGAIRVNDSTEPGYNFAFVMDRSKDIEGRAAQAAAGAYYGKQAVVFQAPGLLVHHSGDREKQVIFWGPDATNIHTLDRSEDRWKLNGKKTYASVKNTHRAITRPIKHR